LTKFIELADAKLDDYLQRLDQSDATESKTAGSRVENLAEKIAAIRERRARCKDMLAQLDRTGEDQISLTDPDSRAMAAHTRVAVGYNVQVAVDTKHKLIVEQQVTNQVVDMGLLTQTAEPAKEALGVETIDVVADKGYFKIEDIEACEKAGMVPYVPRPQRGSSVKAGLFRKDEFAYDAEEDSYICPAGQRLHPYSSSLLRGRRRSTTSTNWHATIARSARSARVASFAPYHGLRTRRSWTGCRPGWRSAPVFLMAAVRPSNTRSARSSNGCIRVRF
jgi:hypothetical protein